MKSLRLTPVLLAMLLAPLAALAQPGTDLSNFRPYDQYGVNVFEPTKEPVYGNEQPSLRWGVAFAQQFQALNHSNEATPNVNANGVDLNSLIDIGAGFNLATANLYMDAVITPGVRVNLATYLSSRHHPEPYVKGGYVQVDGVPFLGVEGLDRLFEYLTLRIGHFEINYGDAHFRRSDNAQALYNPFIGNLIMDGFTTEIGAEAMVQANGFLAMVGTTGGEIQGGVTRPDDRAMSYLGKLGYDSQITDDLRLRLTGSVYTTSSSARNTLYGGDRAGSRFYLVMENPLATTSANFTSGRINPGQTDAITSFMVNPFIKFQGLELFGTYETASGREAREDIDRTWTQLAGEVIYRFLPREQAFVGVQYNTVKGPLLGPVVSGRIAEEGPEVTLDRLQVGAGWFATPNILLKGGYVVQNYDGFPTNDIRHGGKFDGFMIEGVIAF